MSKMRIEKLVTGFLLRIELGRELRVHKKSAEIRPKYRDLIFKTGRELCQYLERTALK